MFHLEHNEVELGLGIHGETGVKRIDVINISSIFIKRNCIVTN